MFDKMKQMLIMKSLLRHVDLKKEFVLNVDASNDYVEEVIQQYHLNAKGKLILHSVTYMSKKFNRIQRNYSTQEREMLTIVFTLKHWRHILEDAKITIRTDHESFKHFRSQRTMSRRLMWFIDVIEHFDSFILYRSGKNQQVIDVLSRISEFSRESIDHGEDEVEDNWFAERIYMMNESDSEFDSEFLDSELNVPNINSDFFQVVIIDFVITSFYNAMKDYLFGKNIEDEIMKSKIVDECVHYVMWIGRLWKYVASGGSKPRNSGWIRAEFTNSPRDVVVRVVGKQFIQNRNSLRIFPEFSSDS